MEFTFSSQRFDGERVIQIAPKASIRVTDEWYRRPNFYTGRALTDHTLILNTKHHIRHMQLFGQHVSSGIVLGLEIFDYQKKASGGETETWLQIKPGIGITHNGEDVSLPTTWHISLKNVQPIKRIAKSDFNDDKLVLDLLEKNILESAKDDSAHVSFDKAISDKNKLIERLESLEDIELDDVQKRLVVNIWERYKENPVGVGFFVLEPLEIIDQINEEEQNQCPLDSERDPFDDEQIIDGCRLVFRPWPSSILGAIPSPDKNTFRNDLAYRIFDYELGRFAKQTKDGGLGGDDNSKMFDKYRPYEPLPWETGGVPLGLTYINADGEIEFIDRYAVVRQGGAPLTNRPLADFNGSPFLWEARIRQFVSHLYDLDQKVEGVLEAKEHFEKLPAVGMLPKDALNFDDMSTKFFPSQFIINAAPIPEEQLEVTINASAGLRPFELYNPEKIKLLVPVPQSVYEPNLLKKEPPDPVFQITIRRLVSQIRRFLDTREKLRGMSNFVVGTIDVEQIPVFKEDQDQVPDETTFLATVSGPDPYEYDINAKTTMENFIKWIDNNNNPRVSKKDYEELREYVALEDYEASGDNGGELASEALPFKGLENFISELEKKIDDADDYLSTAFVETESDIYRLRQLMLGNIKASRLATSPAMGKIVKGLTATPSANEVEKYFNDTLGAKILTNYHPPEEDTEEPVKEGAQSVEGGVRMESSSTFSTLRASDKLATMKAETLGSTYKKTVSAMDREALKKVAGNILENITGLDENMRTEITKKFAETIPAISSSYQADLNKNKINTILSESSISDTYSLLPLLSLKSFTKSKFKGRTRFKKIFDRVYESPASEAKQNAVNTKANVFDKIANLELDINDKVSIASADLAVLNNEDYRKFKNKFGQPQMVEVITQGDRWRNLLASRSWETIDYFEGTDKSSKYTIIPLMPLTQGEIDNLKDEIATLKENEEKTLTLIEEDIRDFSKALSKMRGENRVPTNDANLGKNIMEGLFDPNPTDGDEANYFSIGVAALEHTLEAMRTVDKKLDVYRKIAIHAGQVLNRLRMNAKKWQDALTTVDHKIDELRHDTLVTRSLYEEELARIDAINKRRRTILDEYVTSLTFVRPRLIDTRLDVPSVKLEREYVSPVQASLAEDYEATDELEDMLDIFREVPLHWFKNAKDLVRHFNDREKLLKALEYSIDRAHRFMSKKTLTPTLTNLTYNPKEFGDSINQIIHSHQINQQKIYALKGKTNLAPLKNQTWLDLKRQAEKDLSIADLIEAGKGGSSLARKVSEVMENIEDIAVCLFNRCNELDPVVKLHWARQISIFDKPIDLKHLDVLRSWNRIDSFTRRDLQNLVDWLFMQIDTSIPEAGKLINDLVRTCILLASHAPVSTIIRGYAPEPVSGQVGDIINLAVDKGKVKVGMIASVFTNSGKDEADNKSKMAIQGIVENISNKAVNIKVIHANNGTKEFALAKGSRVKFHKSTAVKHALIR